MCHFRLHERAGQQIVDIAREKAYESGTFNDGMVYLAGAGISSYGICEKILKGKLTLGVTTDEEGHQVFATKDDDWIPPITDIRKLRREVENDCRTFITQRHSGLGGDSAWVFMQDERDRARTIVRAQQILEIAKTNPKLAKEHLDQLTSEVITTSNEKALERHGDEFEQKDNNTPEIACDVNTEPVKHATKHLEPCNDPKCRYAVSKKCAFGLRNNMGCIVEHPEIKDHVDGLAALAVVEAMQDPRSELIKSRFEKQFNFVYKGHEYTYLDSARNQGGCPHCDAEAICRMIHPVQDEAAERFKFIGYKQLNRNEFAVCFECLSCFKKLFYHDTYVGVMQMCDTHPELNKYLDCLED